MKKLAYLFAVLSLAFTSVAMADTTTITTSTAPTVVATTPPAPGWGPSVVGSVGAFYFNGNYALLSGGVNVGAAYTWDDKSANVNSAGIYVGPSSQLVNGTTTTNLNAMAYLNLYQTASAGGFGIGVGTRMWASGETMGKAISANTTFIALGYKF